MDARKFFLPAVVLCWSVTHACAGDREQVSGVWLETHPRDHIVIFADDGSWKLHLKKGELSTLHTLTGTWTIAPDGRVKVTLNLNGKTQAFTSAVKFDGDEMTLIDADGTQTRHKRHTGPLPERFQW